MIIVCLNTERRPDHRKHSERYITLRLQWVKQRIEGCGWLGYWGQERFIKEIP